MFVFGREKPEAARHTDVCEQRRRTDAHVFCNQKYYHRYNLAPDSLIISEIRSICLSLDTINGHSHLLLYIYIYIYRMHIQRQLRQFQHRNHVSYFIVVYGGRENAVLLLRRSLRPSSHWGIVQEKARQRDVYSANFFACLSGRFPLSG